MIAFLKSPGDKERFVFPLFQIRLLIRLCGMNGVSGEAEAAKFSRGLHRPNLMSVK